MIYVGITAILQFYYMPLNMAVNTLFSLSKDPSVLSVLGARVLLNMRVECERPPTVEQGASGEEKSRPITIQFSEPSSATVVGTFNKLSADSDSVRTA